MLNPVPQGLSSESYKTQEPIIGEPPSLLCIHPHANMHMHTNSNSFMVIPSFPVPWGSVSPPNLLLVVQFLLQECAKKYRH